MFVHPYIGFKPLALAAMAALAFPALAADDVTNLEQLKAQLAQTLKVVEQLKQKVDAMSAAPVAAAPAAADSGARLEAVEKAVGDLSANASRPVDNGVPLHGFADVGWAQRTSGNDGSRSGYRLGIFDIYLAPQLGARVKSLIELAFETTPEGTVATDLERMQLGYLFSDALTLWAGRFHTPYGYWNTAYHHGAQIQTAISRPRFVAFEDQGGILPAHSVGLWATGQAASAVGKLGYDVYVVNGNHIGDGVLDFQSAGDDNSAPGVGLRVGFSPKALPGLTLGVHAMNQKVGGESAGGAATGKARMFFTGGYGYFESDSWEVLGEYYAFRNRDLSGGTGTRSSNASYLQVAYNLVDRMNVFARWEKTSLDSLDPYFALQDSGRSYKQVSAGLRYDLDTKSALKLQFDRTREADGSSASWLRAQWSARF
jgi:hypothetical protein